MQSHMELQEAVTKQLPTEQDGVQTLMRKYCVTVTEAQVVWQTLGHHVISKSKYFII